MEEVIKKKPKILLLSDDMRMSSGIATMSREIVMGTVDRFDWYQVGAAIKNPDTGKILDLSADMQKRTGVEDASVKVLPWDGYGNPDLIRQLINTEKPDAILHFTDPRFWGWLYEMEHEIRQNLPLLFYAIWDNLPDPLYNRNFYESCDWIGCISKQTYGIIKRLSSLDTKPTWKPKEPWQVTYVPHGIDENVFKPIDVPESFKKEVLGNREYDFIFFWSNRNIRRKQPSDVIWAFNRFCEMLGDDASKKVALLMHTHAVDQNGTDLYKVIEAVAPGRNIIFSERKRTADELNYMYNMVDCTLNIANNEGFGLTTAESVMAGTPILINVTGGLQDQAGFTLDGAGFTENDYVDIGSLHNWRKWEDVVEWGSWVSPVWSRTQSLAGSVPTPYIIDDRVDIDDVAVRMMELYEIKIHSDEDVLKQCGIDGREAFLNDIGLSKKHMCDKMTDGIMSTIQNWKPRKRYELYRIK